MKKRIGNNTQLTYSPKQMKKIRKKEREVGIEQALKITNLLPLLVLRDLEGYGQARMLRYIEKYKEVSAAYFDDYITLQDIVDTLKDEVKIDLEAILKD